MKICMKVSVVNDMLIIITFNRHHFNRLQRKRKGKRNELAFETDEKELQRRKNMEQKSDISPLASIDIHVFQLHSYTGLQ